LDVDDAGPWLTDDVQQIFAYHTCAEYMHMVWLHAVT
jgi:hypothetical protein